MNYYLKFKKKNVYILTIKIRKTKFLIDNEKLIYKKISFKRERIDIFLVSYSQAIILIF